VADRGPKVVCPDPTRRLDRAPRRREARPLTRRVAGPNLTAPEAPAGNPMSAQLKRSLVAALIAAAVLLVAHWFDAGVLVDAQRQAGHTYDPAPLMDLMVVAHVLTAAGAVALALVAWRSRSVLVGVGYVLVGGFLVCLPAIVWAFAVSVNGAAPLAPAPIAKTLNQWFIDARDRRNWRSLHNRRGDARLRARRDLVGASRPAQC
jgi:hypothetical protein